MDGRYDLGHEIGEGTSGTVHTGRRRFELGGSDDRERACAVKLMHRTNVGDSGARRAFAAEAWLGYDLCVHPNMVPVRDVGTTPGGRLYMVMDRAEETLYHLRGEPTCAPIVRAIASALLAALGHMHAVGIAHGDVHAGNVFLYGDGAIKLGDFGKSGAFGSKTDCDMRADFRRLGLLLTRVITGKSGLLKHGVPRPLPATTPDDLRQLLGCLFSGRLSSGSDTLSAEALRALLRSDAGAIADAEAIVAWMRMEELPAPSEAGPASASEHAADARDASNRASRKWYAALAAVAALGVLVGYRLSPRATRVSDTRPPAPTDVTDVAAVSPPAESPSWQPEPAPMEIVRQTEKTGPEAQTRSDHDRDGAVERQSDPIAQRKKALTVQAIPRRTPEHDITFSGRSRNRDGIDAVIDRRQWLEDGDARVDFYIDNDNARDYRLALVRLVDGQLQPVASVRVEHFSPRVERRDPFVGVIPAGAMGHGVLRLSHVHARAGQSLTLWLSETDGERPIIINLTW